MAWDRRSWERRRTWEGRMAWERWTRERRSALDGLLSWEWCRTWKRLGARNSRSCVHKLRWTTKWSVQRISCWGAAFWWEHVLTWNKLTGIVSGLTTRFIAFRPDWSASLLLTGLTFVTLLRSNLNPVQIVITGLTISLALCLHVTGLSLRLSITSGTLLLLWLGLTISFNHLLFSS